MSKKILVVEDDDIIRRILHQTLTKEGFQVVIAADGSEALIKCRQENPDLILLDLMLPGMDGFQVIMEVRKKKEIPVIILSAKDELTDKALGFGLGVDDYVTKPFSPAELVMRVKAVLRRVKEAKQAASDKIKIADVEIDFLSFQLTVRGESVKLTRIEFNLLGILMRHAGQVLSREQLLLLLHESSFLGDLNAMNVFVHRLRQKIERDPSKPEYLLTVWGVGYTFVNKK